MKILKKIVIGLVVGFVAILGLCKYSETNAWYLFPMFNLSAYQMAVAADEHSRLCWLKALDRYGADGAYEAHEACMESYWVSNGVKIEDLRPYGRQEHRP